MSGPGGCRRHGSGLPADPNGSCWGGMSLAHRRRGGRVIAPPGRPSRRVISTARPGRSGSAPPDRARLAPGRAVGADGRTRGNDRALPRPHGRVERPGGAGGRRAVEAGCGNSRAYATFRPARGITSDVRAARREGCRTRSHGCTGGQQVSARIRRRRLPRADSSRSVPLAGDELVAGGPSSCIPIEYVCDVIFRGWIRYLLHGCDSPVRQIVRSAGCEG